MAGLWDLTELVKLEIGGCRRRKLKVAALRETTFFLLFVPLVLVLIYHRDIHLDWVVIPLVLNSANHTENFSKQWQEGL